MRLMATRPTSGIAADVNWASAVEQGINPCRETRGVPQEAHLEAVYKTLESGLEQVRCAGLYGPLALIRQTRALARSTTEEYFLFPSGAIAIQVRETYWLNGALERLGSLGSMEPFAWYTGAPESAIIAVAHANKVMVLGARTGQFIDSALYPDEDNVAREITASDANDSGRLHSALKLIFLGPDAERYQVTLATLARRGLNDYPVTTSKPHRSYWGSCGVQRPRQGGKPTVFERSFSITQKPAGLYEVNA
jgi:hypothetical protein